jgi:hypothetical protein
LQIVQVKVIIIIANLPRWVGVVCWRVYEGVNYPEYLLVEFGLILL